METEIKNLERKIDSLIQLCRQLRDENTHMKVRQDELGNSVSLLEEKNKMARNRLESIIDRLKELQGGNN